MHIAVIGTGYVGLVSAACFAQAGHLVTCIDVDETKIASLGRGELPIFEPGLDAMAMTGRHLRFTSQGGLAISAADIVFLAVGTPPRLSDGHADLDQVYRAIEALAPNLKDGVLVVTKSTVPIGTGDQIEHRIRTLRPNLDFEVASNPEFLRAGRAVHDFLQPDRVVLGVQSDVAARLLTDLYRSLGIEGRRILVTDRRSSELIKYASNGFLATKIAFINEIADLCEKMDARVDDVMLGIGMDHRIGMHYLQPGPGFGGSCFPKDADALAKMGEDHNVPMRIIEAALDSNARRRRALVRRIASADQGSLRGKTVALLGLTFKADTDDMRDGIALLLTQTVSEAGGVVRAYDPVAMERARAVLPPVVHYCESELDAADGADVLVVATEWQRFKHIDPKALKARMRTPLIVDLRNIMDEHEFRRGGFDYRGIGGSDRRARFADQARGSARRPIGLVKRHRRESIIAAE